MENIRALTLAKAFSRKICPLNFFHEFLKRYFPDKYLNIITLLRQIESMILGFQSVFHCIFIPILYSLQIFFLIFVIHLLIHTIYP